MLPGAGEHWVLSTSKNGGSTTSLGQPAPVFGHTWSKKGAFLMFKQNFLTFSFVVIFWVYTHHQEDAKWLGKYSWFEDCLELCSSK